jgi:uncharacterized OB-fold protein
VNVDEAQHLAATGLDAGFWDGLAEGVVRLLTCTDCERWIWPAQPRCSNCLGTALEWRPVEPTGVVHSWTRTWYPFVAERAEDLPYVVLLVELPGAGSVRLLGVYAGRGDDEVAVGDAVVGVIAPPSPRTFGLPSLTWVRR